MRLAASRRPLSAEAPVQFQLVFVGFVVNKVALGRIFLRVLLYFPVRIIPAMLHTHSSLAIVV
jgi:hypothetical protein